MTWERLIDRIDAPGFPLVLAGPMLRKVTEHGVTVWLALRRAAQVTLEIRITDVLTDPWLLRMTEPTIPIGPRLHMLTITAHAPMSAPLVPGQIYHRRRGRDCGQRGSESEPGSDPQGDQARRMIRISSALA